MGTAASAHVGLAGCLKTAKPTCALRSLKPELHCRVENSRHRLPVPVGAQKQLTQTNPGASLMLGNSITSMRAVSGLA